MLDGHLKIKPHYLSMIVRFIVSRHHVRPDILTTELTLGRTEQVAVSNGKHRQFLNPSQKSVAHSSNQPAIDPELAKIMEAWPRPSATQQQAILAIVNGSIPIADS